MNRSQNLPSKRWSSYDGWEYNGMKERLEAAINNINQTTLIQHAEEIKGQKVRMSHPFSAGQYWICFELVAEDESLIIARLRLPRHPNAPPMVNEDDEAYAIECEVATMDFIRQKLPYVPIPNVYAYEGPRSQRAIDAGAVYMLLEGFRGNTLQDIESDICNLSPNVQEHIMRQWTKIQAEIATLAYSQIGSIHSLSETGDPIISKLAAPSIVGDLSDSGPFSDPREYFTALANSAVNKSSQLMKLGAYVFRDIIERTDFFCGTEFPLTHMDFGAQNILVDDDFNFMAIIDWEFAQTAPWQVNRYPMPFPLLGLDIEDILNNPSHIAYKNVKRQDESRRIYIKTFQEVETSLRAEGRSLKGSFVEALQSPASRIYACFTNLGRVPQADADLVRQMVQLAFGYRGEEAEQYVQDMKKHRNIVEE